MAERTGMSEVAARVRVRLLDVEVTPLTASEVAALVLDRATSDRGLIVGNLNLHGVYVFHEDPDFRAFSETCDVVLVDGAPVGWAGGISSKYRVGSTDWIDALMPIAGGLRVLAIGGTAEAAAGAERHMRANFPDVEWTGLDGYSSQIVDDEVANRIRAAQLVLVGMGMPVQEKWILRNRETLAGKVVANVGGCFDYYAGVQHLAPRWMGRLGVEWLYRLVRAPRRLAYRYLIEPIKLAVVLVTRRR